MSSIQLARKAFRIELVGILRFLAPMAFTEEIKAVAVTMDVMVESTRKRDSVSKLKETPAEKDVKSIGERHRTGCTIEETRFFQ